MTKSVLSEIRFYFFPNLFSNVENKQTRNGLEEQVSFHFLDRVLNESLKHITWLISPPPTVLSSCFLGSFKRLFANSDTAKTFSPFTVNGQVPLVQFIYPPFHCFFSFSTVLAEVWQERPLLEGQWLKGLFKTRCLRDCICICCTLHEPLELH